MGQASLQREMFVLEHPFDNSGFVSMLGMDVLQAFDQEELADVCFVLLEEGKQIFCHKIVLACRSERMRALFSMDTKKSDDEKLVQVIEIPSRYSYAVFHCMLKLKKRKFYCIFVFLICYVRYLYCDRVVIRLELARNLIDLSFEYGLDQLAAIASSCSSDEIIIPPSRLSADLNWGLFNPLLADVLIEVEGVEIPAHKVVLMNRSVYFKAMFSAGLREQRQGRATLPESEGSVFNAVLRFIYTDCVDAADTQLVFDLFCQASLFRIANLQDRCEHVLLDCIDKDNVVTLFEAGDRYGSNLLKDMCLSFIFRHFAALSDEAAFDLLPMDLLLQVKATRQARGMYLGCLERLTEMSSSVLSDDSNAYIDELGVDCPHCKLPFVFSRKDWIQASTPKDMLITLSKGHAEFQIKIVKSQQMGHLACVVVGGKEYFRTRPYGSKRDAEHNVALYALHRIKCNVV
jgi:hypothetical protein